MKKKCKHCGGLIKIRNPKGYCDHLYYPENCKVCSQTLKEAKKGRMRKKEKKDFLEFLDYERMREMWKRLAKLVREREEK